MKDNKTLFISKLNIGNSGVELNYVDEDDKDFFVQQGSLDGACAVYSFFMLLMIQGIIRRSDIGIYMKVKRNTFVGKLVHHFFNDNGMHWEGNYFSDLKKGFEKASTSRAVITIDSLNLYKKIVDYLNRDLPVLVSIQFKGKDAGAHAIVVIGYELDKKGELTKLFCLDPGGKKPNYAYQNNVLLIKEYPTAKYRDYDILSMSQIYINEIMIVE
ncbi:C39 family peptidase [Myroides marinus]|uniref:Peptidase C39-like domain-containing protein n=1 Tax=Myroides marinus TaxID=703342 RepID=A0A163WR66_9FLAO|nr:C39 family peptidase [Myroides marinus]KZE76716.1 hypothetical protein AV926_15005 [Myroides marinus]MDM1368324.1 C39 family peptidase [Myroides marinus]MDM1390308.1 C39 family peptidase [Myroides marinus]